MMRARLLYENTITGDRTYHLDDGRRLNITARALRFDTESEILRRHGVEPSDVLVPVLVKHSSGALSKPIGSLPMDFDWRDSGVRNFFVDFRPGDFTLVGDHWEVSWTLGPGDLEAIPTFRRS